VPGRLSYANVMSTVAVFIALGGGAYAATSSFGGGGGAIHGCVPGRGGALIVVKPGRSCPRGTLALLFNAKGSRGPTGATGATGREGPAGGEGKAGVSGLAGQPGAPGTALGYAKVFFLGGLGLFVQDTKNLTLDDVARPKPGVYCFHDMPFTPRNIQITVGLLAGTSAHAQAPGPANDCEEPGNQAAVVLQDKEGNPVDGAFMVLFN